MCDLYFAKQQYHNYINIIDYQHLANLSKRKQFTFEYQLLENTIKTKLLKNLYNILICSYSFQY